MGHNHRGDGLLNRSTHLFPVASRLPRPGATCGHALRRGRHEQGPNGLQTIRTRPGVKSQHAQTPSVGRVLQHTQCVRPMRKESVRQLAHAAVGFLLHNGAVHLQCVVTKSHKDPGRVCLATDEQKSADAANPRDICCVIAAVLQMAIHLAPTAASVAGTNFEDARPGVDIKKPAVAGHTAAALQQLVPLASLCKLRQVPAINEGPF